MRLSRICFSLSIAAVQALAGAVVGSVESEPAKARHKLSDVVVWLEPINPGGAAPVAAQRARLLQKNKMFHPHVLPITVGSVVDFPNADPIFHNAFSNYDGQLFDVGLYPPGTTRLVKFLKPGTVRVFCNIHPAMSAVILVLDTPLFATAGDDGRFRIENVPPGTYSLRVFDERATGDDPRPKPLSVGDGEPTVAPVLRLSEAGYVNPAHKNKYGQDYPSEVSNYGNGGPPR